MGLAIWFMDDGWGCTVRNRKHELTNRMSIGIATDSFTKEENELIISVIRKKFGIKFLLGRKKSQNSGNLLWQIKMHS